MAFKGIDFDAIKKAAEDGIKNVQNEAQNFDAEAALKKTADAITTGAADAAKNVSEGVRNFDAEDAKRKLEEAANAGASGIASALEGITGKKEGMEEQADVNREFIALLTFLATADEDVTQEEKDKIVELAGEIDEQLSSDCEDIIRRSIDMVEKDTREFGALGAAKLNARRTLEGLTLNDVEKKSICWNLFAVASADSISNDEADFIRFISEEMGLDKAIVEELSGYNDAIIELANAKDVMRASSKSYSEIEPLVNEMTAREQTIIQAAQALVTDR